MTHIMIYIILTSSLLFVLLKWLGQYIGNLGLLHYYSEKKGQPYPKDDELQECINWAIKNWINDLRKPKI